MIEHVADPLAEVAAPRRFTQFPAKVTAPDGEVLLKVKVIVTIDGAFIYGVRPGERKVETLRAIDPYQAIRHDGGTSWIITDLNGDEWTIAVDRAAGCGCGHPLKRMSAVPLKYLNAHPDDVKIRAAV